MICTEEQARITKWCPSAGKPRQTRQDEQCIASDCMLWEWVEPDTPSIPIKKGHGYCGLSKRS